jgi:hypothetical protein
VSGLVSNLPHEPPRTLTILYNTAALNPNIVLTKLRPGQHIKMSLHAQKGIGSDHAKFTPVGEDTHLILSSLQLSDSYTLLCQFLRAATASYRLLPTIKILKSIPPHLADKFQGCFSKGVVKVDPKTKEVRYIRLLHPSLPALFSLLPLLSYSTPGIHRPSRYKERYSLARSVEASRV